MMLMCILLKWLGWNGGFFVNKMGYLLLFRMVCYLGDVYKLEVGRWISGVVGGFIGVFMFCDSLWKGFSI